MKKTILLTGLILSSVSFLKAQQFSNEKIISTTSDAAYCVVSADLDGDGDIDVISSSIADNKVSWYENDGTGLFLGEDTIDINFVIPEDMDTADIDGDGDIDILVAYSNSDRILLYKNDGLGNFNTLDTVSLNLDGVKTLKTADLDGDGDLDVVAGTFVTDQVLWFENDGTGNFINTDTISANAVNVAAVYTADLDGDLDLDIISASSGDNKIAWYINDGSGNFSIENIISNSATSALQLHAADLDGDTHIDVINTQNYANGEIVWYKNNGSGVFSTIDTITAGNISGAYGIEAHDIDGDGDNDLVCAAESSLVLWFENDGAGNFTMDTVSLTSLAALSINVTDLNADGKLDIVCASADDDKIAWYENFNPTVGLNKYKKNRDIGIYPNPVNDILNLSATNLVFNQIQITNILGEVVYSTSGNTYSINISDFKPGTYILRANSNDYIHNVKFIKE
jgi:hypothetical protein